MIVEYSLEGADRLDLRMKAIDKELSSGAILDEAAAVILNRIRTRFLAEEGPDGKWVPSKAGLKRKAGGYTYRHGRKYTATGTLFESGNLFHSIQLYRVSDGERAIRTDVPYARYQQDGDPPRVFLGFNDEDDTIASRLVLRRLKEAING